MNLKKLLTYAGFSLALAFAFSCSNGTSGSSSNDISSSSTSTVLPTGDSPVEAYGELQAKGNKLVGSKTGGVAVQVRGVSLGWSNTGWESAPFFNSTTVSAMVDHWKAEIIRTPIGYAESGGYRNDPSNLTRVKTAIDAAIAKNVYVIIDWHSHNANNETEAAKAFFAQMAQEYGHYDHVIFEIYNEPTNENGGTWENIKAYAEQVIPVIRAHSDNLILVGTRHYSRHLEDVVGNALADNNVGYVLHFYSDNLFLDRILESGDPSSPTFRQAITQAMDANLMVFISEYGTTDSNGGQGDKINSHNAANTDEWLEFMDEKKISSCAWHVNNKNEGSAFFLPSFNPLSGDYNNKDAMTASGAYIYDKLRAYSQTAPWRE